MSLNINIFQLNSPLTIIMRKSMVYFCFTGCLDPAHFFQFYMIIYLIFQFQYYIRDILNKLRELFITHYLHFNKLKEKINLKRS